MRSSKPLTLAQLEQVVEAASSMSFRHRILGHVVPYTGLTLSELCHLRRSWCVFPENDDPDDMMIHIPDSSQCRGTLKVKKSTRAYTEHTNPCFVCQPNGEWTPAGDSRQRSIAVLKDEAVYVLHHWFQQHDSLPFTLSSNFYSWLDELADEASLSRQFGFKALRNTYGVWFLSQDVNPETVAEQLGYAHKYKIELLYDALDRSPGWDVGQGERVTDAELIEALQRLTNQLGRTPTTGDIEQHFQYSFKPLYNHFGGLHAALEEAGIGAPDEHPHTIDREYLIDELHQLADKLGRPPMEKDMREQGQYSYRPYRREFDYWDAALEAAGLNSSEVDRYEENRINRESLLDELRQLANELGRPPMNQEMNERGDYSEQPYRDRFDSWDDALEAAGLNPDEIDRNREQKISRNELLEELRRLANELDRKPQIKDIRERGKFSYTPYRRVFGGISEARRVAEFE